MKSCSNMTLTVCWRLTAKKQDWPRERKPIPTGMVLTAMWQGITFRLCQWIMLQQAIRNVDGVWNIWFRSFNYALKQMPLTIQNGQLVISVAFPIVRICGRLSKKVISVSIIPHGHHFTICIKCMPASEMPGFIVITNKQKRCFLSSATGPLASRMTWMKNKCRRYLKWNTVVWMRFLPMLIRLPEIKNI